MQDFRNLMVWQKGHRLTLAIYRATIGFHDEEKFGLISKIRRAASSVPINIPEGCGREGNKELARFLQISMGSASELKYLLLLARDLKYLPAESYMTLNSQVIEVKSMLAPLINHLRK